MSESDYAPVGNPIGGDSNHDNPITRRIQEEIALSFLDLVILSLLESSPMTGYVLKKRLGKQYHLKASYGTLYPRLKALEKEGILKDSQNFGQFATRSSGTNYTLTPLGKAILDQNLRKFDGFLQKIRSKEGAEPSR
jgi:DNA-binding PadR family transcriptional regulator